MAGISTWSEADIPTLAGRTAVVTGASGGIGWQTARALAARGASVLIACRDQRKGNAAAAQADGLHGEIRCAPLDLADLRTVRAFAERFLEQSEPLDLLVNNAGTAGGPRRLTRDGFELHLGTNHLGHFALTALLMPALLARPGARIVTLGSSVAKNAKIDFDDLQLQRRYTFVDAYARSKLAGLLFAVELDRRTRLAGAPLLSVAADPGIVRTELLARRPDQRSKARRPTELAVATVQRLAGQSPRQGALNPLYAATHPDIQGGQYIAPSGRAHKRGVPRPTEFPNAALDAAAARSMWTASTELTGVSIPPWWNV